jgi:hypothetical protein
MEGMNTLSSGSWINVSFSVFVTSLEQHIRVRSRGHHEHEYEHKHEEAPERVPLFHDIIFQVTHTPTGMGHSHIVQLLF